MDSECIVIIGPNHRRCKNTGREYYGPYEVTCVCDLYKQIGNVTCIPLEKFDTGDILHNLIKSYTGLEPTPSCKCRSWINAMNRWGPVKCREHIDEIVQHLIDTVKNLFPKGSLLIPKRFGTTQMVNWAIKKSEKKLRENVFHRCYVVNLDNTPERYQGFLSRIPADWPFAEIIRFPAVDGSRVPMPTWWKSGGGAWGCYRSHTAIIEQCLNDRVESVLLLEDDAVFCNGFSKKIKQLLREIPADWEILYLGGNHLRMWEVPPKRISDTVSIPHNVNGTFAWALRGRGLKLAYEHLNSIDWPRAHTIDHHMGLLIGERIAKSYAADPFLIGHNSGSSTISKRGFKRVNYFQLPRRNRPIQSVPLPEVIAVVGPFRSGTSAVAGVLHRLGVSMGKGLKPANAANPGGYYESFQLARLCRLSYKEPLMKEMIVRKRRVQLLREWLQSRGKETGPIGAKHPTLCLIIPDIIEAWPRLKIVCTERPMEESQASMRRIGWWPEKAIRETYPRLIEKRKADLLKVKVPIYWVSYNALVADPTTEINNLIEFCKIQPVEQSVQDAISFVRRK